MAASLPLVTTGRRPPPLSTTGSSNGGGAGPAHRRSGGGGGGNSRNQQQPQDEEDPSSAWCAWANEGHRMWVSMPESFWVYTFKVARCPFPATHLWTECPYAHHGERARRRDPSRFLYSHVGCPEYRASKLRLELAGSNEAPTCSRGLRCGYAHGIFEMWLHPARFRTRMCDRGAACSRKICFFAHFPEQRRNGHDAVPLDAFSPPPAPTTTSFVPRAQRLATGTAAPAPAPAPAYAIASASAAASAPPAPSSRNRLLVTRQLELITQTMQRSMRLLASGSGARAGAGAGASSSSSTSIAAAVVTTTTTTAPAVATAPPVPRPPPPADDEEDEGIDVDLDVAALMSGYLASEEASDEDDVYPYVDLIYHGHHEELDIHAYMHTGYTAPSFGK